MQLPTDYQPYASIQLCGNTLQDVGLIFQIGDQAPLLIGRGMKHPEVWIYSRIEKSSKWAPLVQKNIVVQPFLANPIMVIQDAVKPITID